MADEKIYVTQPSLPPIEDLTPLLEDIWETRQLTNGGKYHEQLTKELANYLQTPYLSLVGNGTLALLLALKASNLKGEVITTPYSFVATSNAILWAGLQPKFVDIDAATLNINPELIKQAITSSTTAILATHVYGNPCDVNAIESIAREHDLRVIYDAAHAFGVNTVHGPISTFGDFSALSFHATKVFNTLEGGAVIANTEAANKKIALLRNFGFQGEGNVIEVGLNAKMAELNSAIGLLQLRHLEREISQRKGSDERYRERLDGVPGLRLHTYQSAKHNYSYFPIFFDENSPVDAATMQKKLREINVFARRYFWPVITEFDAYQGGFSQSEFREAKRAADSVLCLPLYADLPLPTVDLICDKVIATFHKK